VPRGHDMITSPPLQKAPRGQWLQMLLLLLLPT
jgi:hypothetical protein